MTKVFFWGKMGVVFYCVAFLFLASTAFEIYFTWIAYYASIPGTVFRYIRLEKIVPRIAVLKRLTWDVNDLQNEIIAIKQHLNL